MIQGYNSIYSQLGLLLITCSNFLSFLELFIRCLEQYSRANGFFDPIHNVGVSSGLRGQYVCPKSTPAPHFEHNHHHP